MRRFTRWMIAFLAVVGLHGLVHAQQARPSANDQPAVEKLPADSLQWFGSDGSNWP